MTTKRTLHFLNMKFIGGRHGTFVSIIDEKDQRSRMLALVCLKFGVVAFIKQVIDGKTSIVAGAAISAQASSFDEAEYREERY